MTGGLRDLSFACVGFVLFWQLVTGNGLTKLPPPDKNLNVYALPVGQGDCTIIQCPASGYNPYQRIGPKRRRLTPLPTLLTVVDMGATRRRGQYMREADVSGFLGEQVKYIEVVTISHPDADHHNYIPTVLPPDQLHALKGVYIGCAKSDYPGSENDDSTTKGWLSAVENWRKLKFAEGKACTTNCSTIHICGGTATLEILGANLAYSESCRNPNSNSLILRLKYGYNFKLLLPGDFQDTAAGSKGGVQNFLIDAWSGSGGIQADFYKLAHHGAYQGGSNMTTLANKDHFLKAVRPKYAFSSSAAPPNTYNHPNCGLYNRLVHLDLIHKGNQVTGALQQYYSCGGPRRSTSTTHNPNNYGIYSTAPTSDQPTIIHIATDGTISSIKPIPYN